MANEPQLSFAKLPALPEQVTVGRFVIVDTGVGNVEQYVGTESGWKKITDKDVYTKDQSDERYAQ